MLMRSMLILAALLTLAAPRASACIWDRDTLAVEAEGLPGIVDIIVGRFDRWPDIVYKRRYERIEQMHHDQGKLPLELYDDIAVAADRLGRSDEAILWMADKRAALDKLPADDSNRDTHEYRYRANLGTFHAHRWIRNGKNRDDLSDLHRAEELIASAIDLNPGAHSGREWMQLRAIRWIIESPPRIGDNDSYDVPGPFAVNELDQGDTDDAIEAICGLVALGAAWESEDAFAALAILLARREDAHLAHLARLRYHELRAREDGGLLENRIPNGEWDDNLLLAVSRSGAIHREPIERFFDRARPLADAYRDHRARFITRRIQQNRSIDAPNFWRGYEPIPAPTVPGFWHWSRILIAGASATAALAAILKIRRGRRRRRFIGEINPHAAA